MSREVGADIYQMNEVQAVEPETPASIRSHVYEGQRVKKGAVLADGPCTEAGELALGRNVLVGSCLARLQLRSRDRVSEKLVKDDYYTSISH